MKQWVRRGLWWGGLLSLVVAVAWAQTPRPSSVAKSKLERLRIAVAPLGWDTNFTWLQTRSGMLDKRPALEYLVGIDRYTGAYIPELAEKWVMSPDGKDWTVTLRKGIPFHEHWGEFTARDVRHAVFLISQPEAAASDTRPPNECPTRWTGPVARRIGKHVIHLVQKIEQVFFVLVLNVSRIPRTQVREAAVALPPQVDKMLVELSNCCGHPHLRNA
jgi:ABC-type transport system substrate-binding protein